MAIKQFFRTKITDTWTNAADGDPLGDIRWQGGKCYKCIKFDNGAGNIASVAGVMAEYKGATGHADNLVTLDSSDGKKLAAGIFQVVIADLDHGWIQIKGNAAMTVAIIGSTSDGDPLTLQGATDDTGNLDLSAANTDHVCAYADSEAGAAPTIVLDCPF